MTGEIVSKIKEQDVQQLLLESHSIYIVRDQTKVIKILNFSSQGKRQIRKYWIICTQFSLNFVFQITTL